MGHLSLYRKYRPQTFGEVVGQHHVTRTLRNAIAEGRVAHAYLFSGPRGTGKTTTARILAKALNCMGRAGPDPDNTCDSCREIGDGSSLDVVEIDAASHGSVDDARDLRDKVAYAPVTGRWRVYIIDECHMLSAPANNALLKVLEEPPAHVVFVFATTEPHKVLQTLLDRCQRYEFRALEAASIAGRLGEIAAAEGLEVDEEAIALITSRAAGSMRDAVSLLDQLASFAGSRIRAEDVSRLFGALPDDVLFEAVELVAERDPGGCFVFTDRLIRSGRDIREFVRALVEHLRSLFVLTHAPTAGDLLDVPDERLERLRAQANRFGPAELLRILDLASELHLVLRQPVDGRLALEAALARMARPDLHAAPSSLLARIERLERLAGIEEVVDSTVLAAKAAASPDPIPPPSPRRQPERPAPRRPEVAAAPPPRPQSAPAPQRPAEPETATPAASSSDGSTPPAPSTELDLEQIRVSWNVLLERVRRRRRITHALLVAATPSAWAEGELVLSFAPAHFGYHGKEVVAPANRDPLQEAFLETFGVRPRIRTVRAEPAGEPAPEPEVAAVRSDGAATGHEESATTYDPGDPVELLRKGLAAEIVEEF